MSAGSRSRLVTLLTSADPAVRDTPFERVVAGLDLGQLLDEAQALEDFRRETDNLYERVRALLMLHALHLEHMPARPELPAVGPLCREGVAHLLARRFEQALERFQADQRRAGPSAAVCSALAATERALAFDTLAAQVRASVRSLPGNRWMFEPDAALSVRPELLAVGADGDRPVLRERTPVRLDLSHSGWSDIFFLAMDRPEWARVLNISVDLAVRGRDDRPRPPVETFLTVVDEPVIRLASVDLGEEVVLRELPQVFDFAADHLGLLRAGLVASGVVPPALEGTDVRLSELLGRLTGGRGLSLVTHVRGIPKGSRLAVSTHLLASMVALCMRATGQTARTSGPLDDETRRLVVGRAILGEWLGGSGGGWQDSGGLWPGVKRIAGALAGPGDPAHGVSRGRLLPDHHVLDARLGDAPARLTESLVLAHGGMAQDVGPVLEMVTERYLLRSQPAWSARVRAGELFDTIHERLAAGDVRGLAAAVQATFYGPVRTIVPWTTNAFTEAVVSGLRARLGDDFWGFQMMGGMAGGGMGFLFDPAHRDHGREVLAELLLVERRAHAASLPFAMDPVVYDFAINATGTVCDEVDVHAIPREAPPPLAEGRAGPGLDERLAQLGFDAPRHERVRADLLAGRIGLAANRLPADVSLEDVRPGDVVDARGPFDAGREAAGRAALARGRLAVVTLAGGSGSRWTRGAGVAKALFPFCRFDGRHRSFLDVHLAKSAEAGRRAGHAIPHVITTSWLTHDAIAADVARRDDARVRVSPGRQVGLRLVPTERDLRFAREETARQQLEERAERVADSLHEALVRWARQAGEASDYRDNAADQCLHPLGHFYEVPNLLLNGTLRDLLAERPGLTTLLVHNVDTVGVDADPGLLGLALESDAALQVEVVARRLEDRGGGLARVDGRLRLVEGLALPRDDQELGLSYYNSMTSWVDIDRFLDVLGLRRDDLDERPRVERAVADLEARLPVYVTLKDVRRRWGHGHEDVFPTAQWERLWGDLTALDDVPVRFLGVPRVRGQQLKEPAQLDGWWRDGSAAHVARLCGWRLDVDSLDDVGP